jgi:hypothetical protein
MHQSGIPRALKGGQKQGVGTGEGGEGESGEGDKGEMGSIFRNVVARPISWLLLLLIVFLVYIGRYLRNRRKVTAVTVKRAEISKLVERLLERYPDITYERIEQMLG